MFSRKILIGSISIILATGGGYYYYTRSSSNTTVTGTPRVITVSSGSVSETIKATGNISAFEESTLSFGREGIISTLYKKEGDEVKSGELIAEITAGTAELDLESARRSLSDAQASYNELFDTPDASDLAKAKATLTESESSLTLMEKQYEALLMDQRDTLTEAEENLELLREKAKLSASEYEYTLKNLSPDDTTDNLEKDIESAWNLVEETARIFPGIIEDIEDITGMKYKASELYGDLGSRNSEIKTRVDALYADVVEMNSIYQTGIIDVRNKGKHTTFDSVNSSLKDTKDMVTDLTSLLNFVLQEFDYTPTSSSWSSDRISTAKDNIETLLSTLSNKQNSINSTLITLKDYGSDELQDLADKNAITSKEQSMKSAKLSVTKAERDLESLKKDQELTRISNQNSIQKQRNTIEQNKYTYEDLIDGPTASEKRSAESKIASTNISLQKAEEGMKDYQITASFDGTIEDIPWAVGETAETTKGILIANKNAYKIELSLDQIDIVKIREGMSAMVTLDAYANREFTGSVIAISATPTITSGVVSYTATIGVSIDDVEVMSSMSTSVSIIISDGNSSILIPSGAITSRDGKSYVSITTGDRNNIGKTEEREVTLGKTTNGKTEVLSGLTVGEKIVYTPLVIQSNTSASGSNTSSRTDNQMMRGTMGGATGGPPPGF